MRVRSDPGSQYNGPYYGYPQPPEQGGSPFPRGYPQRRQPRSHSYPQVVHRRPRRPWIIVLLIVVVLGLGLIGVAVVKPDLLPFGPEPVPTATAEPPAPPVLAAGAAATLPAPDALRQRIDPLLVDSVLGDKIRISVVDVRTGQILYEREPNKIAIPASNAKVITAVAVLATLGPAHRLTTHAVAGANPGEVVLVGAGDPTLGIDEDGFYAGAATLEQLADQIKTSLGGTKPSKVVVDGSLYSGSTLGPDWEPTAPDEGFVSHITALMVDGGRTDPTDHESPWVMAPDPEIAAGKALAKLLGVTEVVKGKAPAGAADLGSVQSAPMIRQVEQMLRASDNMVAESLARQVAIAKGKAASFAGAGEAVQQAVVELGLPGDQIHMVDGSGYSRLDQLSPNFLTGVLIKAAADPRLGDLFNLLAVAGWSGSMDYRFAKPESKAGLGVVRAKSGTLNGVNSITGVVQTVDGGLVGFAVLAEDVPIFQYPAQEALDAIVAKIAACGC